MLNPDSERVKIKLVPYKLNSTYDYYESAGNNKYSMDVIREGIN